MVFGITRQALNNRERRLRIKLELIEKVLALIAPIRKEQPRIGTYKLHLELAESFVEHGIKMGRDKLNKMLRDLEMLVQKKKNFMRTTDSNHYFLKHKNLVKGLEVNRPEQVWVSDITYIKTDSGYDYLSLITDYYSKRIVGYHLSEDLTAEGPLKALEMAVKSRKYPNSKLIHHSDRGIQYCCDRYIKLLERNEIKPSMTEKYDPYENAVAERVNGILKDEFDIGEGFVNHWQAVKEIRSAINIYNTKRRHYSCEMMTPDQAHLNGNFKRKKWGSTKKPTIA